MLILIMGVSGAGKSTVGSALARELGWVFLDADEFHPAANIAKMAAGQPLDEADRQPWLAALRQRLAFHDRREENVVLACSALKEAHRAQLTGAVADAAVVFLAADPELIDDRLARRTGHFMSPKLAESQFDALEPPRTAVVLDPSLPRDELVRRIRSTLAV
ncbi:MAG: gluconokinase [Longimicrobiales bacterium]